MTVISTNLSALRAANASTSANNMLSTAMNRLSTGNRINSAKDDAAGLAISTSMSAQIRGMSQAIRNANDGIALAQTADGSLDEASNILQRMRELAVQSASGTYGADDRKDMQTEVTELKKQLDTITKSTFNNVPLFSSTTDTVVNIQTGSAASDKTALTISKLNLAGTIGTVSSGLASAGLGSALQVGDTRIGDLHTVTAEDVAYGATIGGNNALTKDDIGTSVQLKADDQIYEEASTAGSVTGGVDISDVNGANSALTTLDDALKAVSTTRASIGAGESRLQSAVNSLTTNSTNLTAAKSQITDTDFSAETANLAKAQILSQASTAMLAQANQSAQGVLKLLQ